MNELTRTHVRVSGRVQGVGFRRFVAARGRAAGLRGWVRNQPDGSLDIMAEGAPEDIAALLDDIRRGPPGARVTTVSEQPPGDDVLPLAFMVRFD